MTLQNLAEVTRKWAAPHDFIEVVEQPGWATRGKGLAVPYLSLYHHTASNRNSGALAALSLVLDGSPRGYPNALCNLYRSRRFADGHVEIHVVAGEYAWHAGRGGYAGYTSRQTGGLEAENDGIGEDWLPDEMVTDLVALAALLDCGPHAGKAQYCIGHKEWAPTRKIDPTLAMDGRRKALQAMLNGQAVTPDTIGSFFMIYHRKDSRGTETPTQFVRSFQFALNRFFTDAGGGPPTAGWLVKDGVAGDQTFAAAWEAILRLDEPGFTRTGEFDFRRNGIDSPAALEKAGIDPVLVSAIVSAAALR